jgi:hypothetical protein
MTKYAEISALAGSHAERFFAHKEACERVALKLSIEFQRYLEAPSDTLKFVELDEDLMAKREEMNAPKMRHGRDGYWYFALRVHFKSSRSAGYSYSFLKFGLHVSGSACSVKLDGLFTIDLHDTSTFEPLFADIVRGYREYYSAQPSSPVRAAGFIQGPAE